MGLGVPIADNHFRREDFVGGLGHGRVDDASGKACVGWSHHVD